MTDVCHTQAQGDATLVDDHEVFFLRHTLDGHHSTRLVSYIERAYALTAAVGHAIVVHNAALTVPLFADHKHRFAFFVVDAHHTYHFIVASVEHHAAYAGSVAPHGAHCAFAESDGATIAVGHDDFVRAVGECHADHAVVFVDVDRVHTVGAGARVLGETSLLDHAALRGEDHIVRLAKVLIAQLAHLFLFTNSSFWPSLLS